MERLIFSLIFLAQGAVVGMISFILTGNFVVAVIATIVSTALIWRHVARSEDLRRQRAGGTSQYVERAEAERRDERHAELRRHGVEVGSDGLFRTKP